ncbi:pilin [Vibrio hannami]|uniref:pilin n=1 Tax=Vibrio hannami TaxID=2717094 RepID=UPI00240F05FD|nr:pilin [Vibrio hannami]MDG3088979.1 pilin [Vibrio hannami]
MKNGFTLIELMIVVAIVGVLVAIAIPQYQTQLRKSEITASLATASALKVNLETYLTYSGYFPSITTQQDLTEKLGASPSNLGSMSTKQNPDHPLSGQIIMVLSGTQFRHFTNENTLALERDEMGIWHCVTNLPEEVEDILPAGCNRGDIF